MSAETEWRDKYRDALTKLAAEESRASQVQHVVRLLIGRLCLAAQGREAQLDRELSRVAASVRRQIDPQALELLLVPLSEAVAVLDAAPIPESQAPAAAAAGSAESADLGEIVHRLALLPEMRPAIAALRAELQQPPGEAELLRLLDNLSRIATEQRAQVQREKLELENLLQLMTSRLDEIASNLQGEVDERAAAQDDTEKFNLLVTGEVEQLKTSCLRAADLGELRKQVSQRLDAIGGHLQEFRGREESRLRTYRERVGRMRSRIRELERESRTLHVNLQEEQRLAMIDALTGIPNRAAYDDRIEQEFKRWKRFGRPVSILAWDIDRFKTVNDAYGHKAGDKVLRVVGQHLAKHVRETDFVARYGGEEFVMLLVGSSAAEARQIADKIRLEIAELGFHFHDRPVQVTASCGVTGFAPNDSPDGVFDRADRALYRAKEAGRNCCVTI